MPDKLTGTKHWWQSKAVWAGVVAVLIAGYNMASEQFGIPPIPEFAFGILGALGVWGRATATTIVTK